MRFIIHLALLSSAAVANSFIANADSHRVLSAALMKNARRLNGTATSYESQVDLSSYVVKFEKCFERAVMFKLCPASDCDECATNYGEYLIELEKYLDVTVAHAKELEDDMCYACEECGGVNNQLVNVDCSTCAFECEMYRNTEANGYIDASNFLECQLIYDPEDDSLTQLYAGPLCTSSGSKITIGVFTDEYCTILDPSKDVDDYLLNQDGMQVMISHALLKTVYAADCISCNQEDRNGDSSQALEMCGSLHEYAAAKCEAMHGFAASGTADGNNTSHNALIAQEATACNIIDSLTNGTNITSGKVSWIGSIGSDSGGVNDTTLDDSATSLTSYTVKFEKCIDNKAFNARLPVDQDNPKRVVLFKLCPANSCDTCTSNYGEYLIDLETYLEVSIERAKQEQEIACDACRNCSADRDVRRLLDVDCSTCADECEKIANMEANGYYDASVFIQCQLIYDPPEDSEFPLWGGPLCTSAGSKITIGVFTDKDCTVLDANKDVDNYLVDADGSLMKLSHALLKTTYYESCRSCAQEYTRNGEFLSDMCGSLHEYAAAKCEAMHGFAAGGTADGDNNSPNVLIAQEASACDMIHNITNGTYTSSDIGAGVEGESDNEDEGGASISNATLSGGNSTRGGEVNLTTNNTGVSVDGGMEANETAEAGANPSGEQGNPEVRASNSTSGGDKTTLALTALGSVLFVVLF